MNVILTPIYIKRVSEDPNSIFSNQFYLKNTKNLRFHVFLYFLVRKRNYYNINVIIIQNLQETVNFVSIYFESPGTHNLNKDHYFS